MWAAKSIGGAAGALEIPRMMGCWESGLGRNRRRIKERGGKRPIGMAAFEECGRTEASSRYQNTEKNRLQEKKGHKKERGERGERERSGGAAIEKRGDTPGTPARR